MGDKFFYVVMEDGEFSACFATLEGAQKFCANFDEQDLDCVIIIEIPVDDIYTPVLRSEKWKRAPINKK